MHSLYFFLRDGSSHNSEGSMVMAFGKWDVVGDGVVFENGVIMAMVRVGSGVLLR